MKVPASVFANLGPSPQWEPILLKKDVLDAARNGSRDLWPDASSAIAGFDVGAVRGAEEWGSAQQIAMLKIGTGSLGIPQALVGTVGQAIGPLVLGGVPSARDLGKLLGSTAVGVATNALSAYPMVGVIARAIGGLVNFLLALSKMPPKARPDYVPQREYSEIVDGHIVNAEVLTAVADADWTALFLPRIGTNIYYQDIENGFAVVADDMGAGVGLIPGSQQISAQIEVSSIYPAGKKSRQFVHRDVGDFYPGAAKLCTALASQVQSPTACLYTVDTDRILSAWTDLFEAVIDHAESLWKGIKKGNLASAGEADRHAVVRQMVAPYFVTMLPVKGGNGKEPVRGALATTWSPGNTSLDSILEVFVKPWVDKVRQRQEYYLGTTVVATVAPDAAAFKADAALNAKRVEMQKLLLDSPALDEVNPHDIIDPDFRQTVHDQTIGSTFAAEMPKPKVAKPWGSVQVRPEGYIEPKDAPPSDPPQGPPGLEPVGGGAASLATGLLALGGTAALAVGGVAAARALRKR